MAEWNDTQEKLLQNIGEKAKSWDWLHQTNSSNLTHLEKWVGISSIVFNAGLTALNTVDLWGNPIAFNFAVLLVSITATSLATSAKYLNYKERIEAHRLAGQKFKAFSNNVQVELSLKRKDRSPAQDTVKAYIKEYNELIINCPNIDDKIINKFKTKFGMKDFSKPELVDEIRSIKIKEESHNSSDDEIELEVGDLQKDLEKALGENN